MVAAIAEHQRDARLDIPATARSGQQSRIGTGLLGTGQIGKMIAVADIHRARRNGVYSIAERCDGDIGRKFRINIEAIPLGQHAQSHSLGDGFAHCAHGSTPFFSIYHQVTGIASLRGVEIGTSYFCIRNAQICADTGPAVRPPKPVGSLSTTVTTKRGLSAGMATE